MSMLIPVNPEFAKTSYDPIDEGITYQVLVEKFEVGKEPDKNGNKFWGMQVAIVSPEEWEGRKAFDSYIGFPINITASMPIAQRRVAEEQSIRFWQMVECFKIKIGPEGFDSTSPLGKFGFVTLKNDTFNDRVFAKIKDFLLSK